MLRGCQVRLHWLAIDGVQPRTADNPHVECSDESVAPPMDLSREMQYLYSRIVKVASFLLCCAAAYALLYYCADDIE